MVTLYTDPAMADHRPHAGHPERPERLTTVLRHLGRTGQLDRADRPMVRPATDAELLRVHSAGHLRAVRAWAERGAGQVEADTWVSPASDLAARLAAGAVIDAVAGVVTGPDRQALCIVRPPGHHARPDDPMGFCLYGSVAAGAAHAVAALGLNRVLVVDWDVHHGNGTQEMFYADPRVGFFSMHRHPFYPGGGLATETGTGAGLGATANLPIRYGTSRPDILAAFRARLENFVDRIKPELILISAGFDGHAEDPVGDLGMEVEDFEEMGRIVGDLARYHAAGRIVSVLEGGYNVSILAGCVSSHLEVLEANERK